MTTVALFATASDAKSASLYYQKLVDIPLEGAKKLLFTNMKFDGQGKVAVKNVDGGYPASLIDIHNAYRTRAGHDGFEFIYQEAYDAVCLNQFIDKSFHDVVHFVRGTTFHPVDVNGKDWIYRIGKPGKRRPSLTLDLRAKETRARLQLAEQMYRNGAVLSLPQTDLFSVLKLLATY